MKSDKAKALGYRLKMLRVSGGVKQKDLAKQLEVSQSYISDLESGRRMIPTETLFQLAEIFSVGLDYFDIRQEIKEIDLSECQEIGSSKLTSIHENIIELKKDIEKIKKILQNN